VFGPKPRDYHFKLNKKVKDLARRSALTYKAKDGSLKVIDSVSMTAPKTSEFAAILKAFRAQQPQERAGGAEQGRQRVLSARNLQNTRVVVASELNTYDIMNANGC
jgi:large subunit ribosomal protein L4